MKRQAIRGRAHGSDTVVRQPHRHSMDASEAGFVLGFRLAHDCLDQVTRGGRWAFTEGSAGRSYRFQSAAAFSNDDLGLRLCVDWREG